MKPRLHNLIAACLLLTAIGGHLVILQSVAWMGMLVTYSQADGFATAFEKTFDGKHPCNLCKVVDQAKQESSEKKTTANSEIKLTWMLVELEPLLWLPNLAPATFSADESAVLVFGSPSLPPPRAV